ncbi:MAG: hypothetical protein JNM12_15330 [Alphaproteobacteria bacterium]|nr:hypothetical protein [Alphaproteobacteria bacterium]
MAKIPICATFDTNTYSTVARPQFTKAFSKLPINRDRLNSFIKRVHCLYLNWCIRRGRIVAGLPEPALSAEVLKIVDRIALLINVGTPQASNPPAVPATREEIIKAAFKTGFHVLRYPRIGYGAVYAVDKHLFAVDRIFTQKERLDRQSNFARHFKDYPLERLQDLGEQLSLRHGLTQQPKHRQTIASIKLFGIPPDRFLWREGLEAEEASPLTYANSEQFLKEVRKYLADWVDFDIASCHYAYGYSILCSEDKGKPSSNSIFSPQFQNDLSSVFGVKVLTIEELSKLSFKRFGIPILSWKMGAEHR